MVSRSGRFHATARACTLAGTILALASALVHTQEAEKPRTNPLQGNPSAVKQGQNIYRGRCAVCHGIDAKGYRGSDLTTGDWVHGGSDAQIFQTIRDRRGRHRDAWQPQPVGARDLDGDRLPPHAERAGRAGGRARRRDAGRADLLGEGARQLRPVPHGRRRAADGLAPTSRASARRARCRRSNARSGARPRSFPSASRPSPSSPRTAGASAARARTRTRSRCR